MSGRRRIILHIGAGKTGSSAIQSFLDLNVDALGKEGIIVPDNNLDLNGPAYGNHVRVFKEWAESPVEGQRALEAAVTKIFERVDDEASILISAENLAALGPAPAIFEGLAKNYDINVILYIRRQDEFILSAWQQWNAKVQKDFLAWLLSSVDRLGNWKTYITNWERVVSREKITVRIFDRNLLANGDVVADFFSLLDLKQPFETFVYPEKDINPSFNDAIMDLVQGDERVFDSPHDNRFQNFVSKVTGDRYVKSGRESLLTEAQRRAILHRYAASNRWVQENYFPERIEGLFAPIPDNYYFQTDKRTKLQQQLGFIVRVIFGLYKLLWLRARGDSKHRRGR